MIADIRRILCAGEVVPLKSGQMPPMYPKLWLVNWPDKLVALSGKFHAEYMKEQRTMRGKRLRNEDNGAVFQVLKRGAPAVAPKTPYSAEELALYEPHQVY